MKTSQYIATPPYIEWFLIVKGRQLPKNPQNGSKTFHLSLHTRLYSTRDYTA